tara:strand:- start:21 stop:311 length:291 start_codon:yes stop_codon:yes gene_type:complete
MKYALIENNIVKQISYQEEENYVKVDDIVFADMVKQSDGSYDYTDEYKTIHQPADTYVEKRAKEYPSIVDQLDKIYHSGIDEWKKVIKITKDKYPK